MKFRNGNNALIAITDNGEEVVAPFIEESEFLKFNSTLLVL